ncbi:ATP-binding protein [Tsukamurella sp. NPDC003166]|uniref:HAMP domain-containing sensor histidine kinase n=1 Tax=Tsukamurella sp. NPDC003166 TaxID=3154444 RepID=UPI0033B9B087
MTGKAEPRRRSWSLSGWPIAWRVAAVLAVPLLLATILGGSRIWSAVDESGAARAEVTRASGLPDILEAYGATAVLGAAQIPRAVTPDILARTDRAVTTVQGLVDGGSLPEDVQRSASEVLTTVKEIRSGGTSPTQSPQHVVTLLHQLEEAVVGVLGAAIGPIDDAAVRTENDRLAAILAARTLLLDESVSFLQTQASPTYPRTEYLGYQGAERSALQRLAGRYPANDARIAELNSLEQQRAQWNPATTKATTVREQGVRSSELFQTLSTDAANAIRTAVDERASAARTSAIRDTAIVLLALALALAVAVVVARSITRPLRTLEDAARRIAHEDLPAEIDRIKHGEAVDGALAGVPIDTQDEIGEVARAVDALHGEAVRLAGEQVALRTQVDDMLETLARRSRGLVDRQLEVIESMEYDEKDPRVLDRLFALDHLAARMRRSSDNLLIIADKRTRGGAAPAVPICEVLHAATSEVEEYRRVRLAISPPGSLAEPAATDVAHLVAELLDNALRASPPDSDVQFVVAEAEDRGMLVEIVDRGIGIPRERLAAINEGLEQGRELTPEATRQMGLLVVSRLAKRHGVRVRLHPTIDAARNPGITATVHIPAHLIVPASFDPQKPSDADDAKFASSDDAPLPVRVPQGELAAQEEPVTEPAAKPVTEPAVTKAIRTPYVTPGPNGSSFVTLDFETRPVRTAGPGLPQRTPGGSLPAAQPQPERARPAQAQPVEPQALHPAHAAAPVPAPPQEPAPEPAAVGTPIFDGMVSAWLTDPNEAVWGPPPAFDSIADMGWTAARDASQSAADRTANGLPHRRPGHRLVPGAVTTAAARTGTRDPESIRASLNLHQQGVRRGRAHAGNDGTQR